MNTNSSTSEPLRLLVIDPDPETAGAVQEALRSRNDIYFLAQCTTALEAVPILREPGADIVLCEAELPGVSGFSLSEFLPSSHKPVTIFTNGSAHHAAAAFEASAVDYLLKPILQDRLQKSLDRAVQRSRRSTNKINTGPRQNPKSRLAIRTGRSVLFLEATELDWAEAEGKYVRLHLGKETLLLKMSITALEAELDPALFVRIHRSTLVNVDRVRWLQPWMNGRNYQLVLHDGTRLTLTRKDHLRRLTQRAVVSV